MKDSGKSLSGSQGEKAAARYLEKKGYCIVKRNYRTCGIEVDLIAAKEDILCFVEVKTRKRADFGLPQEFVDYRKKKKIILAARVFSGSRKYAEMSIRFDIVSVVCDNTGIKINHIENAFEEE